MISANVGVTGLDNASEEVAAIGHFLHPVLCFVTINLCDSLGLGNSKKEEKQKKLGLDSIDRIA
jgi:hypothetical protein